MHKLILIGTSAGGLHALTSITSTLPANFPATILIVMHIGARRSMLPEILQKLCPLPISHAQDGDLLAPGRVLVAPPDYHLTVENDEGRPVARLWHGPKENYTRPAIDPLFRSAAAAFDINVIGVILTGYLDDGTAGLYAVKARGGYAIVQDPQEAQAPDMPASAVNHVTVDQVLPIQEIAPALVALAGAQSASRIEAPPQEDNAMVSEWIRVENRFVKGEASMQDLQRIGVPSGYTCPECSGALWKISGAVPPRFRCHTGHSFSSRVLSEFQDRALEEALWSALRALQEKVRMEQELVQLASDSSDVESERHHRERAEKLLADIATLRELLSK